MPSESEPVYVEQVLEDRWILPMFGSTRKHFKVSRFSHRLGEIHLTQKTNDMIYDQLVSDLSAHNDKMIRSFCVTWMTWLAQDQTKIS